MSEFSSDSENNNSNNESQSGEDDITENGPITIKLLLSLKSDFKKNARKWGDVEDIAKPGFTFFTQLLQTIRSTSRRTRDIRSVNSEFKVFIQSYKNKYTDAYMIIGELPDDVSLKTRINQAVQVLNKKNLDVVRENENEINVNNGRKRKTKENLMDDDSIKNIKEWIYHYTRSQGAYMAGRVETYNGDLSTAKRDIDDDVEMDDDNKIVPKLYVNKNTEVEEIVDGRIVRRIVTTKEVQELTKNVIYDDYQEFTCENILGLFSNALIGEIIRYNKYEISGEPIEFKRFNDGLFSDSLLPNVDPEETSLINIFQKLKFTDPKKAYGGIELNPLETQYKEYPENEKFNERHITDYFEYVSYLKTPKFKALEEEFGKIQTNEDYQKYKTNVRAYYDNGFKVFRLLMNPLGPNKLLSGYQMAVRSLLDWQKNYRMFDGKTKLFHLYREENNKRCATSLGLPSMGTLKYVYKRSPFGFYLEFFQAVAECIFRIKKEYVPVFLNMFNGSFARYDGENTTRPCWWNYGRGATGKSHMSKSLQKILQPGTYLDQDADSSKCAKFTDTIIDGILYFFDESPPGLATGGKKSDKSKDSDKDFKLSTTKNELVRSHMEYQRICSDGVFIDVRFQRTMFIKCGSQYVINSNDDFNRVQEAIQTRLLATKINQIDPLFVTENKLAGHLSKFDPESGLDDHINTLRDVHHCSMLIYKCVYMKFQLPPDETPCLIYLLSIMKSLNDFGMNEMETRLSETVIATAKSFCYTESILRLCAFSDSPYVNQDFDLKYIFEAGVNQIMKIEHMIAAVGCVFQSFANHKIDFLSKYAFDTLINIQEIITLMETTAFKDYDSSDVDENSIGFLNMTKLGKSITNLSSDENSRASSDKSRDRLVLDDDSDSVSDNEVTQQEWEEEDKIKKQKDTSPKERRQLNYNFHLYGIYNSLKQNSKKMSFRSYPQHPQPGMERYLDLNYITIYETTLDKIIERIKNVMGRDCLLSNEALKHIVKDAAARFYIKPQKVLRYVKESDFEKSFEEFYKEKKIRSHITGNGINSRLEEEKIFKRVRCNEILNPADKTIYDGGKMPAIILTEGYLNNHSICSISIHLDLYKIDQYGDLEKVFQDALGPYILENKHALLPTPFGLKEIVIKARSDDCHIPINDLKKKDRDLMKNLNQLWGNYGESRDSELGPDAPFSARLRFRINNNFKLSKSGYDLEETFLRMRKEQLGLI